MSNQVFLHLYKPEYDQMLIDHMSEGLSFSSFAGLIGVSAQTLYNWKQKFSSFSQAADVAEAKSQLFWEKALVNSAVHGVGGNAAPLIFALKARFGWSDRGPDASGVTLNVTVQSLLDDIDGRTVIGIAREDVQPALADEQSLQGKNKKRTSLDVEREPDADIASGIFVEA